MSYISMKFSFSKPSSYPTPLVFRGTFPLPPCGNSNIPAYKMYLFLLNAFTFPLFSTCFRRNLCSYNFIFLSNCLGGEEEKCFKWIFSSLSLQMYSFIQFCGFDVAVLLIHFTCFYRSPTF